MEKQDKDIVRELRQKASRDNRDLLDRAADEIERLRKQVEALGFRDFPNNKEMRLK